MMDEPCNCKCKSTGREIAKLILVALAAGFTGFIWPDNPVEQAAESYIENKTGVHIDLTPQHYEEGNKK